VSNFAQQYMTSVLYQIILNKHFYVVNNSSFICVLILVWAKCEELLLREVIFPTQTEIKKF